MSLHYLFACELDKQARSTIKWRTLSLTSSLDGQPLKTWEHVRHELELKLKVSRDGMRYNRCSFLSGMVRDVYKLCGCKYVASMRLQRVDVLQAGMAVVLFRRPPPVYFTRFVPLRYRPRDEQPQDTQPVVLSSGGGTEEDLLAALQQHSADVLTAQLSSMQRWNKKEQRAHPDDHEYTATRQPVPFANYVCRGCGALGEHFRQDCPDGGEQQQEEDGEDVKVKAVDKIAVPTGIPKTFLQAVKEEEVDEHTMVTRDGKFVKDVRKSMVQQVEDIRAEVIAIQPTQMEQCEDGEMGRFDFEDYLEQVVDVKEAKMKALVGRRKKIPFMCTHWLQGLCHKGILCEYLHYYDVTFIPICKFFMEGKCTNASCTFQHVLPSSAKRVRACRPYSLGFCPAGPSCPDQHQKREAPCLADFEDERLFHQVVAAFNEFVEEHRQKDVVAKKRYLRAPTVTKMLYERKGKRIKVNV